MHPIRAQNDLKMNDGATAATPRRKRHQLTIEQQDIAARHVPLARGLAKPFKEAWPLETDEFESAACFALTEAAQSFEPERNVKFATFARFRILGALRDVQRQIYSRKYEREMPNARTYRYVPSIEERAIFFLTTPDAPVNEYVDAAEEVEYWVGKLSHRHAVACREMYIRGRTQLQVAAMLGCSKSRVSFLHAEALDLLRESGQVQAAAAEHGLDINRN